MSKMGISDVASYCGAQIFDAIGLAREIVDRAFVGTPCPIEGLTFADLEREILERFEGASGTKPQLENPGYYKWRKGGEPHETNGDVVDAAHEMVAAHHLRKAVKNGSGNFDLDGYELYEKFAELVNGREPMELRDLLELRPAGPPVPLEEVEPIEAIVTRFSSGAMSHGALSAEAHETIAIALNRLGARANTGEGGEDPVRYRDERNSPIKQVASGRLRRDAGVRRLREGASDQDRAGLEARRGRAASWPQGLGRDRAAASYRPGRRADLAAPPPRHLLDRGSRAAHLRPEAGQPEGGRLREAGLRERRRPRRRGRRQGALGHSAHLGLATAAPEQVRSPRSRTRAPRGSSAWPRHSRRSLRTACAVAFACASMVASRPAATCFSLLCSEPTRSASERPFCWPKAA